LSYSIKFFKVLIFSTFLISTDLDSQEISENYLQSVPDYLQGEVLEGVDTKAQEKNLEAPNITLVKTQKMLDDMEKELENINARFSETYLQKDKKNNKLKRFGDDFFNTLQTSYSPINDPNPPSTYVLESGDTLRISIIGNNSSNNSLKIARDGSINIPKIGNIQLAGLELSKAVDYINQFVSERSLGSEVYSSIENLKDIQVLVIGGVESKGIYTLGGNTNILHIINVANGISKNGSYRNISVLRNGNNIKQYDLYDIFISGKISSDFQFASGDTIKIGFLTQEVSISGGVNNPAIYEYKFGDSVADIINLAEGLLPYADSSKIEIKRANTDSYSTLRITEDQLSQTLVEPMDNIYAYSFKPTSQKAISISINGSVNKPGTYVLPEGSKLSELILMAGGYNEQAYPFGAQLYREMLKEKESAMRNILLESLANNASSSPEGATSQFFYRELKNNKPIGRLNIEFDTDRISMNPSKDTLLFDGDNIVVPSFPNHISVYGEVSSQGSYEYSNNLTVKEYINFAGGVSYFGDKTRIILISPNGKSYLIKTGLLGDYMNRDISLYPGSLIYIPRQFGFLDTVSYVSTIAPIFSSLALSIASLNTINN